MVTCDGFVCNRRFLPLVFLMILEYVFFLSIVVCEGYSAFFELDSFGINSLLELLCCELGLACMYYKILTLL